jgi:hypothetical protein
MTYDPLGVGSPANSNGKAFTPVPINGWSCGSNSNGLESANDLMAPPMNVIDYFELIKIL